MDTEAQQWIKQLSPQIEQALTNHLPQADTPGAGELNEAVRYAVFSGGKRMRPVLTLVAGSLVGCDRREAQRIGAAMEYLHTSSLILDDLPCMDDTSERRGLSATHKRFGEGVAVLAAMALLNQTYALLGESSNGRELIRLATDCIGHRGMVAGQTIDLAVDANARVDLREEHYLKTTALFRLAMIAPAIAGGAGESSAEALGEFGHCAGMAYQLIDDAHDLEADAIKDGEWDGVTPSELRERAKSWVGKAKVALVEQFGDRREVRFLTGFADWLLAGAQTPATS